MIFVLGGKMVLKNQNGWDYIASSTAAASTVKKKGITKRKCLK
jgi:hypothetical protein